MTNEKLENGINPNGKGSEQNHSPFEVTRHYAFINENKVCYAISSITADLPETEECIHLEEGYTINTGDKYINGVWSPAAVEPSPDEPSIFQRLEAENAELAKKNVELWEILVSQGVI
ncbi:hypothetical protein [Paenibacillus sp. UNC451MF]|uniref:hypothetical protein n=1 Tax=Paenibacillus sp. UNC451MF TaxID=1449063 RepID=UPI00048A820A|nr:hypothetical protein [Paenibacillus sp. UNC451MF]